MTTPGIEEEPPRPKLERETTRRREEEWKKLSASAVGIEMAVAILIGMLVGRWLDGRFDTDPLWMAIGAIVGMAAAFKGLIRVARQHQRDVREKEARAAPGGDDDSSPSQAEAS